MTENTAPGRSRGDLITALLHRAPDNSDHVALRNHVHDLADAGLAVMFVHPQSKAPADMRAPRQRIAADKAAQTEARAAGRRNWQRVKSPSGLALATTDAATLDQYLTRYVEVHGPEAAINLAIEVGGSGLVVVDADTPEQVAAFLADGSGSPVATVSTPGQCDAATGEFVHHGGGHWYFAVPTGVGLPEGTGAATLSGGDGDGTGYAVLWNRRYVLIPPSTRPEGEYKATGDVHALPGWLADRITAEAENRAERAAQRQQHAASGGSKVERWGAGITWAEILGGTDWIDTGKPDSCGCSVWTAPGLHASIKSGTAHEPGCGVADSDDPCLHIWTDHGIEPFDAVVAEHGPHLTRLRALAAIHHDNDLGAAMTALDLHDDDDLSFPGGIADSGDDGRQDEDDDSDVDTDEADDDAPDLALSEQFWNRHPRLRRFHDMCLSHTTAPDAALGFVLARLAAHIPPGVRVDTGVRFPLPLNLFVFATSVSGAGKTTAGQAADEGLVTFRLGWGTDPLNSPVSIATDGSFPALGSLKTGEGLVEAYYGERTIVIGENKNGTDKTKVVRSVVRSNLLTTNDEGRTVIGQINKDDASLGATMREMWSGSTVGASLADRGRDRLLRRGTYSLGVMIGTQQSVLGDLVTRTNIDEGTVQRFLMVWSRPGFYVTADYAAAASEAAGEYPPIEITVPDKPLRLCASRRATLKRENMDMFLSRSSAKSDPDEHSMSGLDSQRAAMVARLAALLTVFLDIPAGDDGGLDPDDPRYLTVGDLEWSLAEELFAASCAIAADAATRRRARRTNAARAERAVARAEHVADVEARTTPEGRARAKLIGALTGAGPIKWSGPAGLRNRMFNGDKAAAAVLDRMVESGQIKRTKQGRTEFVELAHL